MSTIRFALLHPWEIFVQWPSRPPSSTTQLQPRPSTVHITLLSPYLPIIKIYIHARFSTAIMHIPSQSQPPYVHPHFSRSQGLHEVTKSVSSLWKRLALVTTSKALSATEEASLTGNSIYDVSNADGASLHGQSLKKAISLREKVVVGALCYLDSIICISNVFISTLQQRSSFSPLLHSLCSCGSICRLSFATSQPLELSIELSDRTLPLLIEIYLEAARGRHLAGARNLSTSRKILLLHISTRTRLTLEARTPKSTSMRHHPREQHGTTFGSMHLAWLFQGGTKMVWVNRVSTLIKYPRSVLASDRSVSPSLPSKLLLRL